MAYTFTGMKKMDWRDVEELHDKGELAGYYLLYQDDTEAQIERDYSWSDIVAHYESGGEFGYEL